VHVEIWSDIACPWCFVGKRRFEAEFTPDASGIVFDSVALVDDSVAN
jgi:hypothetical protein